MVQFIRQHKIVVAFTIVYILSIAALSISLAQQDHITRVDKQVNNQIIQRLDAGKVCRQGPDGVTVSNCRALIERLTKSSTKAQRRRIAIRLIRELHPDDIKKLGLQPRAP